MSEAASAIPSEWTAEQVREAQVYGTCQTCGAPRTSITTQLAANHWLASMACLNGHREPAV
jgi:hypothetical protein